jgi:hypothetical protein
MQGIGFNKVRRLLADIEGLSGYIYDIEPVESLSNTYGHNGGLNFTVMLPNEAFTKLFIRYRLLDDTYTIELTKYDKLSMKFDSAVVDEYSLNTLLRQLYEEISLLNGMKLDDLIFTLSKTAQKDFKKLKDLDKDL